MTFPIVLPCDFGFRELEPGLGLSKFTANDFHNFLSLSYVITGYVRMTRQVSCNEVGVRHN
jgi:hypothetical protein